MIVRKAIVIALGVWLGCSPAGASAEDGHYGAAADACRHYENRARFKPRRGDVEFVTVIADACHAIGHRPDGGSSSSDERLAAAAFLEALSGTYQDIREINSLRLQLFDRHPEHQPKQRDLRSALRLVSPSGEFLILRQAGVFRAVRSWVGAGATFELASAIP